MKEVKFKGTTIEIFDGIHDLDLQRYIEFSVLFLEDINVGSDIGSIGRHYQQFHQFISTKDVDKIHREAINLHSCYYNMIERINVTSLSFAPFIYKINGNVIFEDFKKDFSVEKAMKILTELSNKGLKYSHVSDTLEDVKKKLITSFEPLFQIDLEGITPIITQI